jgi:aldose 1-epimerase
MASGTAFGWRLERDESFGTDFIVLRCSGGDLGPLEAWVAPGRGSNLCRLSLAGENIIDFEGELLAAGDFTGTPVLYPTPNRVRSGIFRYLGKLYNQAKRGEPVFEHGLVHNEPWQHSEPVAGGDSIALDTWIDFAPEGPLFESFPFRHRLGLSFTLGPRGIAIAYSIANAGEAAIPYGFGLHPYFMKLDGEEGTSIALPATLLMDSTSDLLPTGRLIEAEGTQYDLRAGAAIGGLDLDHVFTGIVPGASAEVRYRDRRLKVVLRASADFSHLVVYSPRGQGFFCIENQTCSTDAHNLYDRGFAGPSGLAFAQPGAATGGTVEYRIERL